MFLKGCISRYLIGSNKCTIQSVFESRSKHLLTQTFSTKVHLLNSTKNNFLMNASTGLCTVAMIQPQILCIWVFRSNKGNLVSIIMMSRLSLLGLRPLFLVGGATGLIGDPSGKVK